MSRTPSTSIGTRSSTRSRRRRGLDLVAQRVARPAAGSTSRAASVGERHRLASRRASRRPARARRALRRAGARRASRGSLTGSVTTALASSRSATSPASRSDAPSVSRSDTPGATARASRRRPAARADGSRCRRRRASRGRSRAPAASTGPCRSASISLRMARARSMHPHAELGRAPSPRRPRTSSCTPSSASSWRTCSETFDCTVWRRSAAAVKLPVFGHREQRFELANVHAAPPSPGRIRRPRGWPGPELSDIATDRYYRFQRL